MFFSILWDVIVETVVDGLKMLPVLYLAYLLMEVLEHHAGEKMDMAVSKVGKAGPLIGAALGTIPQCGFSGAVAGFYAGGVATLGTMIAVFLSTSDEMLPLLISHGTSFPLILKLLLGKICVGVLFGYLVDLIFKGHTENRIETICEQDDCDCENHNVFVSALIHTAKVFGIILLVTFVLNLIFGLGGENVLRSLLPKTPVLSEAICALFGLIPSCSVSVFMTELYLNELIGIGPLFAALSSNAGVGLLVLFRQHRHGKENLKIVAILYVCGLLSGLLMHLFSLI